MDRKSYWEKVYQTKQFAEVSWYQQKPAISLSFIKELGIQKQDAIIDVGGGDSYLVDYLLNDGFTNITVLDISEAAINRAQQRLGERAGLVNWVVADITTYKPDRQFDCWHDRAAFHFLTEEEDINSYIAVAGISLAETGRMIVGTFSESGPEKCSGLFIKQYSETSLTSRIKKWFDKIKCIQAEHITPFKTIQHFLFCSFKKHKIVYNGI